MNDKIKELNRIIKHSKKDRQISNKTIFSKFTDFQCIMLSYISLLELLYEEIDNKTIKELYLEENYEYQNKSIEYDKIMITEDEMLNMSDPKNSQSYKNIVLGKLIRYGFAEIKIIKKIIGKHGFDAFILEDKKSNKMVYFPCTNLIEHEDYIYDTYPILANINDGTKIIGDIFGKQIYESQQHQAKNLLEDVLINTSKQVHVAGYSLGGSLAESSYLNSYKKHSNLGNIILFNPYHNNLNKKEVNILKKSNKLKLYVCEGDTVSCVFNYYDFHEIAKPVYINYKYNIDKAIEEINNNQGITNRITLAFKNEYLDYLIKKCKLIKKKTNNNRSLSTIDQTLENIIVKLTNFKSIKTPISAFLKNTSTIIKKIPGIKSLEESTNHIKFLLNINYIETILTSTHLTYTVDYYKKISFDKNGSVKKKVKIDNKQYNVSYPSFTEVNKNDIGYIINVLNNNENNTL